jgi:hypothetical protein
VNDSEDYYKRRDRRHEEALDLFIDVSLAIAGGWAIYHFVRWL